MLTPEFLEELPGPIVELYQQAEDAILADMARRIANTDLWTPSADWQYRKLREVGALSEDIIAELAMITGKSRSELRRLMQEAAIASMGYDEGIYESHGMTGEPLASSEALTNILNAGYRATAQTMRNLTRTTANTASQQFERTLDGAWMKVQSGAFSADEATRSAVKELAGFGLKETRAASEKYAAGPEKLTSTPLKPITGNGNIQLREELNTLSQEGPSVSIPEKYKGNYDDYEGLTLTQREREILLDLRQRADDTGFEHGQAVSDNGETEVFTSRAAEYVDIPEGILDRKRVSFYHSHTNVTPFSAKDYQLLVRDNVEKVSVVASNGDAFTVSIGYGYRPTLDEFTEMAERIRAEVDVDILSDPDSIDWSPEELVYMAIREQAYRIARVFEWRLEGGSL